MPSRRHPRSRMREYRPHPRQPYNIRRRRRSGSGFSPGDGSISGLYAWYAADQATVAAADPYELGLTPAAHYDFSNAATLFTDTGRTTPVSADTDVIKGVTDLSGNGRHLSEATNGPAYRTGVKNGRSIARFDGTNDVLSIANDFGMDGEDKEYTVFAVMKSTTEASLTTTISWSGVNASEYIAPIGKHSSSDLYFMGKHDGTTESIIATTGVASTSWAVATSISPGATGSFNVNGVRTVLNDTAHNVGDIQIDGFLLGALANPTTVGFHWDGDLAEVIVFTSSSLAPSKIAAIERYLGDKWGIATTGTPSVTSDPVQVWADLTGNGRDFVQTTASTKPTWVTGVQNGRPVVRFDGTDDKMGIPTAASPLSAWRFPFDGTGCTFIMATTSTESTAVTAMLAQQNFAGGMYGVNIGEISGNVFFQLRIGAASSSDTGTAWGTTTKIVTGTVDATGALGAFINGVDQGGSAAITPATGVDPTGALTVGGRPSGADTFAGDVCEILIFSGALSTADRQKVERYLANKWGVSI